MKRLLILSFLIAPTVCRASVDGSGVSSTAPAATADSTGAVPLGRNVNTTGILTGGGGLSSDLTLGASLISPSTGIASGIISSNVQASSVAVNSIYPAGVSVATYSNITLPAANVASGSLGSSVISSSITLSAMYGSPTLTGTNITSIPAASIDAGSLGSSVIASSVTLSSINQTTVTVQGNMFNSALQLVQLNASGLIPNLIVDGSSVTKQGVVTAGTGISVTPTPGVLTIAATSGLSGGSANTIPIWTSATAQTNVSTFTYNLASGFMGIGTSNPSTILHISSGILTIDGTRPALFLGASTASSSTYQLAVATGPSGSYSMDVSTTGHINSQNNSGVSISSCGSAPVGTAAGSDFAGTISVGGGVVTACTLTFSKAFTATPTCLVSDNSSTVTSGITSINNSAFTVSTSATLGGGRIYYICVGSD